MPISSWNEPGLLRGTMDREIVQRLFDSFISAAGAAAMDGGTQSIASGALDAAGAAESATLALPASLTGSILQATAGGQSQAGGGGGESTLGSIVKSVFGLAPLIGGLIGLFTGGGDPAAAAPLVKYAMPARLDLEAAATDSGLNWMDYDQAGAPREHGPLPTTYRPGGAQPDGGFSQNGSLSEQGRSGAQITVNVQAMDARSFLDRSGEIAAAVREAMLNLNPINDVVNDL